MVKRHTDIGSDIRRDTQTNFTKTKPNKPNCESPIAKPKPYLIKTLEKPRPLKSKPIGNQIIPKLELKLNQNQNQVITKPNLHSNQTKEL